VTIFRSDVIALESFLGLRFTCEYVADILLNGNSGFGTYPSVCQSLSGAFRSTCCEFFEGVSTPFPSSPPVLAPSQPTQPQDVPDIVDEPAPSPPTQPQDGDSSNAGVVVGVVLGVIVVLGLVGFIFMQRRRKANTLSEPDASVFPPSKPTTPFVPPASASTPLDATQSAPAYDSPPDDDTDAPDYTAPPPDDTPN
jgi:hypothetical protein